MKKTVFTLLAGAALLTACQPTDKRARMDITLTEMQSDTLVIGSHAFSDLNNEKMKRDTLLPGQTTYTFVAETDFLPYQVFIASTKAMNRTVVAALLPGDRVRVTGSIKDYQVTGSELSEGIRQMQIISEPYRAKMDSLVPTMTREIYRNVYIPLWNQMDSVKADYVRQHPDDDLSLYILNDIRGDYFKELYPTLSDKVKNGPLAPIAQAFEEGMKRAKIFEENKKNIVEGTMAPDFTLKDINGEELTLSSLRGKYVVLDFWGSWCGWCIKGIPDMKKYYEKYKGKMEILGIDCRDTEEKWKAAVAKYELPWLHVRNEGEPDVSLLYAVQGYPTKIVIDPEGKIAKIVVGESPAFYEYLDELFN